MVRFEKGDAVRFIRHNTEMTGIIKFIGTERCGVIRDDDDTLAFVPRDGMVRA